MKIRNIIAGILCLLTGCAIYLLLRSDTIRLYRWVKATVGTAALDSLRETTLGWDIPEFVRFSLPDGMWCAAYVLIADGIWGNERGLIKHIIVSFIPAVAIGHECLQLLGLARGTFDPSDLLCYAFPLAVYFFRTMRLKPIFSRHDLGQ